ncbi:hypothetical protein A2U01_0103273, partial [Trifolium medium]|nr:hypothetical protein [Trifolium medium]
MIFEVKWTGATRCGNCWRRVIGPSIRRGDVNETGK